MASGIRFGQEDWERIRRDYDAWWAGELERPLVYLTTVEPDAKPPTPDRFLANYPATVSAEALCDQFDARFRAQRFHGDAFPFWFINFGPGILAGFLGGRVNPRPDTVWFEAAERREMREIDPALDLEGYWWRRMVAVTEAACERWDGLVAVSYTDLGGNLDVVASLRTTEGLLLDLVDAPEEVERVLWKVSAAWRECYGRLTPIIRPRCAGTVPWAPSWSPRRTYMLQCDFCYMISPAMFERFVLPELASVCEFLDDAFYHLDGPGALPHLDMLLGIGALKGVQWVPGAGQPDASEWPEVLARIRAAGKLCQIHTSPEGAMKVTRELGGKGFQFLVDGGMTGDEAEAFVGAIRTAGG